MAKKIETARTHRTWFEKLKMWHRAYETKMSDEHHEVIGRGATPEASREVAERRWAQTKPAALRQQREPILTLSSLEERIEHLDIETVQLLRSQVADLPDPSGLNDTFPDASPKNEGSD